MLASALQHVRGLVGAAQGRYVHPAWTHMDELCFSSGRLGLPRLAPGHTGCQVLAVFPPSDPDTQRRTGIEICGLHPGRHICPPGLLSSIVASWPVENQGPKRRSHNIWACGRLEHGFLHGQGCCMFAGRVSALNIFIGSDSRFTRAIVL